MPSWPARNSFSRLVESGRLRRLLWKCDMATRRSLRLSTTPPVISGKESGSPWNGAHATAVKAVTGRDVDTDLPRDFMTDMEEEIETSGSPQSDDPEARERFKFLQ